MLFFFKVNQKIIKFCVMYMQKFKVKMKYSKCSFNVVSLLRRKILNPRLPFNIATALCRF